MSTPPAFEGRYEGTGTWYDSAGNTQGYKVRQTNRVSDTGFAMEFKHDFDDGAVVEAHFVMLRIAPHLFQIQVSEMPIGNGYWFADTWHYHLDAGGKFVEVSYRVTATGLRVFGSSSKNADGHYIAWHEELRRITASGEV